MTQGTDEEMLPPAGLSFNVNLGKTANERQKFAQLQRLLVDYKREKRGPTFIAIQSAYGWFKYFKHLYLTLFFAMFDTKTAFYYEMNFFT